MSLEALAENDIADVTAIVRESATSFYHGMKILEADQRAAMYGIYAFCRKVDDIADDDDVPLPEKRQALKVWRQRIAALFAGNADDATTRVLRASAKQYHLREVDFIGIIDGMEMDGGAPIVAPPLQVLDLYCDRVASAVGRLSVCVFGDTSAAAQDVAYALGRALQLTNILRDVREDAQRGRLYLPYEYLVEEYVPVTVAGALASPQLPLVCAKLAELADKYFAQAEASMRLCRRRAMRPAKLMAASYRPLLGILRASNFAYSEHRVSLPKYKKLLLAARLYLP
jgi:presqualene diphosphate synthase